MKKKKKRRGGIKKLNGRWDFKNIFVIARTSTADRLKVLIGQQQQINETVLKKACFPLLQYYGSPPEQYARERLNKHFICWKKNPENVFLLIGTKPCDNAAVPSIGWVENISMEIN